MSHMCIMYYFIGGWNIKNAYLNLSYTISKTHTHTNIKTLSPVSNDNQQNNNVIVIALDIEPQHVHQVCEK